MKIEKRNPLHWCYLTGFAIQGVLGLLFRALGKLARGRRRKQIVVLYGHKLNGNLLALYRAMNSDDRHGLQPVFLTMDSTYRRELNAAGIRAQSAYSLGCAVLLSRAAALVSDHGLHALQPLHDAYRRAGLLFFDVWHGIPFKGFDADDFRLQHRYDETWVASDLHRQLYIERFGFPAERVFVTGYARTDCLVASQEPNSAIRQRLGLPREGRLILFAPTWAQDVRGRSVFPFGESEERFLAALSAVAQGHVATVLVRTHMNSAGLISADRPGVIALPGERYPNTEEILQISDALICDWSSIAFDYLLLDRPTFFLDVPAPFRKGCSLGTKYRFGEVVQGLDELTTQLARTLIDQAPYWAEYGERHALTKAEVYGTYADGRASQRCVAQLLTFSRESSR